MWEWWKETLGRDQRGGWIWVVSCWCFSSWQMWRGWVLQTNYWRGPTEGVLSSFRSPLAVALRCYCPAESNTRGLASFQWAVIGSPRSSEWTSQCWLRLVAVNTECTWMCRVTSSWYPRKQVHYEGHWELAAHQTMPVLQGCHQWVQEQRCRMVGEQWASASSRVWPWAIVVAPKLLQQGVAAAALFLSTVLAATTSYFLSSSLATVSVMITSFLSHNTAAACKLLWALDLHYKPDHPWVSSS